MTETNHIDTAAAIVAAYVSRNAVAASELPKLLADVHGALVALAAPPAEPEVDHRVSPAAIRKSITPDHLVSFIDGKPYKSLKRHIQAKGYTVESYKAKYGLPADYPLVASSYAAKRSELAKSAGLGQVRRNRRLGLVA